MELAIPDTHLWQDTSETGEFTGNEDALRTWCSKPELLDDAPHWIIDDLQIVREHETCNWFQPPSRGSRGTHSLLQGRTADSSVGEKTFDALADRWKRETALQSSISAIVMHPAYLEIIGMGSEALPLILRRLKEQPDHWFTALRAIAKTNPVNPKDAGNLRKMRKAWLKWGKRNGHLD